MIWAILCIFFDIFRPIGLKFFMGIQDTIIYRLVLKNLRFGPCLLFLIFWALTKGVASQVWGLKTRPYGRFYAFFDIFRPIGLKFFMGTQDTIIYRLVLKNLRFGPCLLFLIFWALTKGVASQVWGLKTRPYGRFYAFFDIFRPIGLKFFMGTQDTIIYRLVLKNLRFGPCLLFLIFWALTKGVASQVWGLKTRPKS